MQDRQRTPELRAKEIEAIKRIAGLYERDYYLWIKGSISLFKEEGLSEKAIHTIGLEELFSAMHYYKTSTKQ